MREEIAKTLPPGDDEQRKPPLPIGDFGFYHRFEYVSTVVFFLERSNFVTWPEPGGLNDQLWELVQDAITYLRIRDRLEWERDHPFEAEEEASDKPVIGDDPPVIQWRNEGRDG